MKIKRHLTLDNTLKLTLLLTAALPGSLSAQTTISQQAEADTYVSSGQPAMNFGTLGAMEIAAPTAAQNRTEETLDLFDTSAIEAGFNAEYGADGWDVTSVTLQLFSNDSTAGTQPNNGSFNQIAAGDFELDWLSDNNWSQTAITWNNISAVLPGTDGNTEASLGDFDWMANGAASTTWTLGLDPNLVNNIDSGGEVTIFGQPTAGSTVGYLFNQVGLNGAVLNVTAAAVPDTSSVATLVSSLAGLLAMRRWTNRK